MQVEAVMYNVQGKASYITTCYIPKNKKVIGDGNQSQTDQEEVKSNFIADIKYACALGKSGSNQK